MTTSSLEFIDYPESELVIGVVAATGTDTDYIEHELKARLDSIGYKPQIIRLSKLLERTEAGADIDASTPFRRIWSLMDAGDKIRSLTKRGDALALLGVQEIAKKREGPEGKPEPTPKTAYILRSLKHPSEVITLRRIYREGFYLLGVFSPEKDRIKYLHEDKFISQTDAETLIKRDQSEDISSGLGQETRDTFHLADAFISLSEGKEEAKKQLWRTLDLIFRHPFETPTPDEHAMYLAYATSFRSGDLSRQVGAVVTSFKEEILAVGTNDVPRYGGGLYNSTMEDDARDYKKGEDSNAVRKGEIIADIQELIKKYFVPQNSDEVEKLGGIDTVIKNGISKTLLSYITEFGRPVHAEMEALLSCARKAVSPKDGTLYTTTFPCHNCAKHIIDAGIKRVVYVEPYPKSLAGELYDDSIDLEGLDNKRVKFEPFVGIGSRRFMDLFSMGLSTGHPIRRKKKDSSEKVDWQIENSKLRVPMLPTSYLEREVVSALLIKKILEKGNDPKEKN